MLNCCLMKYHKSMSSINMIICTQEQFYGKEESFTN